MNPALGGSADGQVIRRPGGQPEVDGAGDKRADDCVEWIFRLSTRRVMA